MRLREEIRRILKDILNEGKNPFEIINYYLKSQPELVKKLTNRNNALLKKIAFLDIEFLPDKMEVGKIFPWLLNQWKKGDPLVLKMISGTPDDNLILKFKSAQELFNKSSFKKTIGITDVQKFNGVEDFINKVNQAFVEQSELPAFSNYDANQINNDIKEGLIAKSDLTNDNFFVVRPLKKKGACKYGNVHNKENMWCTANVEHNAFDSYKDGVLYIFMDKKDNLKSKYQFYYKEGKFQFMDEFNKPFDYEQFFNDNITVFQKLFPKVTDAIENDKKIDFSDTKSILKYLPSKYKQKYFSKIEMYASGLLGNLIQIKQGKVNPEEFFSNEDIIGFGYDDLQFFEDGMTIYTDLQNIDEYLDNYYYSYQNGYEGFEFNWEEYDYMGNYIQGENKKDLMEILRIFDPKFTEEDFDEEGKIYEIMSSSEASKYFNKLLENFATNYENAINSAQSKWIDGQIKKLPFELSRNSLTFKYNKFIEYCIQNSFTEPRNLLDIIENVLSDQGLTEDNYYDYYNNDIDHDELYIQLKEDIANAKEEIENDDELGKAIENKKKFEKILKDLKFQDITSRYPSLSTDFADITIYDKNFPENKVYIKYDAGKEKGRYDGWIDIDDLHRYATMPTLFEENIKIRTLVKNIIKNINK